MARTMVFCTRCKREGNINDFFRVDKNNRGQRGAYICPDCAEEMHDYSEKNREWRGSETVHPFTYSVELEVSYTDEKTISELYEYKFLPTEDPTVKVEYKSAIMRNLKSLAHLGKVLDKLIIGGHLEINDDCGTHFHVGHEDLINYQTMEYIEKYYHTLYVPLCKTMEAHPYETTRFWGRYLGGWAHKIDEYSYPTGHANFINIQHDDTIEYRLCKFRDSDQYMKVAKFCTKLTEIVCNNFVAHYNDRDFDKSRYSNIHAYRKHKAQVAAEKMVKAYLKAING